MINKLDIYVYIKQVPVALKQNISLGLFLSMYHLQQKDYDLKMIHQATKQRICKFSAFHNISHNKMIYLLLVVTDDLLLRQKSLVIYQSGSIYRSVTNPSVADRLFTNPAVVTDHLPIRR